jgi:glyoxylase-like metal-dependent hydrolase (beta-lactamase superfamily II)
MLEVAPDVHQLSLAPRDALNAYLVGDVLVDAGVASSAGRIVRALAGGRSPPTRSPTCTPTTPAARAGSWTRGTVPVWVGAGDAEAMRRGEPAPADNRISGLMRFASTFSGVDVARELREGDELAAGFVVLDAPGHSPGHVAFWRAADRVLIAGDVWFHLDPWTLRPKLREPFGIVTISPARNRESIRRLTALEPDVVAFGHGPVLRDAAPKLAAFAALLK